MCIFLFFNIRIIKKNHVEVTVCTVQYMIMIMGVLGTLKSHKIHRSHLFSITKKKKIVVFLCSSTHEVYISYFNINGTEAYGRVTMKTSCSV